MIALLAVPLVVRGRENRLGVIVHADRGLVS